MKRPHFPKLISVSSLLSLHKLHLPITPPYNHHISAVSRRPSKPISKITSSPIPTFQFSLIHPISKVTINPRKRTMSDNIPFEIQLEIIKKVSDVKSLVQFRSVSKPWKSFIDSSEFIKGYGARDTQPISRIVSYKSYLSLDGADTAEYICLVGNDIQTFKKESAPFILSPLLHQYRAVRVVNVCHGLLCLFGFHNRYEKWMVVIWNHSIRKSFGISVVPRDDLDFGFGVCPVTRDPTVVKLSCKLNKPWHVEVFTLSSGVWNVIPSANLPRQSIKLDTTSQVVIDRFIYWSACENISTDDDESTTNHMVVSFDLISKEFKVVDLPDSLTNEINHVSVSKLRESLVVYGRINAEEALCSGVWVMERDSSFTKLYSICAPVNKILGFTKVGEPICETISGFRNPSAYFFCGGWSYLFNTLDVYDPCSQCLRSLGISGLGGSFSMGSYKESLLLLDRSGVHIYSDVN